MNYGYACPGWSRQQKTALAAAISQELNEGDFKDARGQRPYLEVDGMYDGVRVRRITHLDESRIDALTKVCDALYLEHAAKTGHVPKDGDW